MPRWVHRPGGRRALRLGHAPRLRRGGDHHRLARRPDTAQRFPVVRRRGAAAGRLPAVLRVEIGLLDLHLLPLDVELLGDQHRQHRLDALPDLGVLRHDRHRAVGGDADERGREERRRRRRALLGQRHSERLEVAGEQHPAARERRDAQESTTIHEQRIHSVACGVCGCRYSLRFHAASAAYSSPDRTADASSPRAGSFVVGIAPSAAAR